MRPEPQQPLDSKALKVWRIEALLTGLIIFAVSIVLYFIVIKFRWPVWIPVLLAVINLVMTLLEVSLFSGIRWRQWRYEITDHEIYLKHGLFTIERVLVPMTRVQHVETKQGPILRKYGLATVNIATAAGTQEIPALSGEVADAVRDRISALARVAQDDV